MNTSHLGIAALLTLASATASASDFFAPWGDGARRIEAVGFTVPTRPESGEVMGFAPWARATSAAPVESTRPQLSVGAPGFRPWS